MYPLENARLPNEGKANPAQILKIISGEISILDLMRYKTSDAIKSAVRKLVPAQELGSQFGHPGMEEGSNPR